MGGVVVEDICIFNKDAIIIKPPMKTPASKRILVLLFALLSGVYIFSVCLKQTNIQTSAEFLNIESHSNHCLKCAIDRSQSPFWHYPKPTTFNRSGSGWFETLLNSHTNVSSNGEIFSVAERRTNASSILLTLDQVYNLDWFSSASKNHCSAAVGFKWMLNQGIMEYHEEIVNYFNGKGVTVIFLFRRNLLRRMVSVLANSYDRYAKLLNGTHKSHVHSPEEAETLASYKPKIDPKSLVANLKSMEKMILEALEYFRSTRHIILYYEDLVKNRTKLVDVQNFLGLPLMPLTSKQVKIHKGPLREHITNWDEVSDSLRGTTYEGLFDTDYSN